MERAPEVRSLSNEPYSFQNATLHVLMNISPACVCASFANSRLRAESSMGLQVHNYQSEDVNGDTLGPHNASSNEQNIIDYQMTHTMTGQKGVVDAKCC